VTHKLLIVDDNALVRRLVRAFLERDRTWEVCGEAENGEEGVRKVRELQPDAVILDLQMPVMNGLEAAREIHLIAPLLLEARAVGISDVLSKMDPLGERLLPALKQTQA
jgi:DNA-binding NarL/FixJ family response regulator